MPTKSKTQYNFSEHDKRVITSVVNMFIGDEQDHWEECGRPEEHIYHDLVYLKNMLKRK